MDPPEQHRKTVRHYNLPGHAHELTFSTYKRRAMLLDGERPQVVLEAIGRAAERHGFDVLAFVLMPEHVHLIVFPREREYDVSALLAAIKRPSSFRIKREMAAAGDSMLRGLVVQERAGKSVFRFWQAGGGYDRNIVNDDTLRRAVEYLHQNPVRRGLCREARDWAWSSCRQYLGDEVAGWVPRVRRLV